MSIPSKQPIRWRRAASISWREARSAPGKFLFVIISVAIGVGALVGVRGFNESFQKTLLEQARGLMAGDISARLMRQPSAAELSQLAALARRGVQQTWVTEMVSMVSVSPERPPLLVSLKAVDPAFYPFSGTVELEPSSSLKALLKDDTVIVAEELLIRMQTQVGASLKIGNANFRIAGILRREPDRLTGATGLGPRVLMTRTGLARAELLQRASRSGERLLLSLGSESSHVADIRTQVEHILPEANVTDFRESNPALTDRMRHSTEMMSLICLVAMVLGAIGVAMSMRAHLQQHMDTLAIMKSMGASSYDILRIYGLQTLLLGLAGGILGVGFGLGVQWILPSLLGNLLPVHPELRFPVRSVLGGLGTGVLTTLLFCLPPLLDVRRIRPVLVLRKMVEAEERKETWSIVRFWKEQKAQIAAALLLLLALGCIAALLSDSWMVGRRFTAVLSGTLVVLLALSSFALRSLRWFLGHARLHLPSALRHGLANLYRPGNQSAAVLAALGTGVMLILTVFLMQRSLVRDIYGTIGASIPNVFLVDVSSSELNGVRQLLAFQRGIQGKPEFLPVVSGRVAAINGISEEKQQLPRHLTRGGVLTWSDEVPMGSRILSGSWWDQNAKDGVAIESDTAKKLHLQVGSSIDFLVAGRLLQTHVVAVIRSDGQHIYGRAEYIFPQAMLKDAPVIWYGAAHVEPQRVAQVEKKLFEQYPTVTIINMADVFSMIEGVANQIILVVHFLAGFSMLAGVMILASSVASTRFRRVREVVVLKTLGATRRHVLSVFSVEFVVLGLLAGAVGVGFANLLTVLLLRKMELLFRFDPSASALALVCTGILAMATGWVASYRILGQKPLEILREE